MSNYLTIEEAAELANIDLTTFKQEYIDNGRLSVNIDQNSIKKIELSELLRVFPGLKYNKNRNQGTNQELELNLQKIEHLEYVVANLERQLQEQKDEHKWLKSKYDNTSLLLEQKLDTSELEQYKKEIQNLAKNALEWEKKYNALLASQELKNILHENRHLKQELLSQVNQIEEERAKFNKLQGDVDKLQASTAHFDFDHAANASENLEPSTQEHKIKTKRKKFLGIF